MCASHNSLGTYTSLAPSMSKKKKELLNVIKLSRFFLITFLMHAFDHGTAGKSKLKMKPRILDLRSALATKPVNP